MENKTKAEKGTTLEQWYNSLPANLQIPTRDKIISECEITYKTFYSWVNAERIPKKPYRDIILKIAATDIHFTVKEQLAEDFGLVK